MINKILSSKYGIESSCFFMLVLCSVLLTSISFKEPYMVPSLSGNTNGSDYETGEISYDLSGGETCPCSHRYWQVNLRTGSSNIDTYPDQPDANDATSYNTGTFSSQRIGPNATKSYYLKYFRGGFFKTDIGGLCFVTNEICGGSFTTDPLLTLSTVPIKKPSCLNPSNNLLKGIELKWGKGTNIPNNQHGYKIYKEGQLIHTVEPGEPLNYFDPTGPDEEYLYAITTFTNSWGGHESEPCEVIGRSYYLSFIARGRLGRIDLSWNPLPTGNGNPKVIQIQIFRDDELEAIAKIEPQDIPSYTDFSAIPGYLHDYWLELKLDDGSTVFSTMASAYHEANGLIEGFVREKDGSPVKNIIICADSDFMNDPIPEFAGEKCDTTDENGFYRIDQLYYDRQSDIKISPLDNDYNQITPSFHSEKFKYIEDKHPENIIMAEADFKLDTEEGINAVITVNGDGINDTFVIPELERAPEDYPNNNLIIMNRWGDVVYEASPYNNDWDGTHYKTGEILPVGTYFYIIRLDLGAGEIRRERVTLIR